MIISLISLGNAKYLNPSMDHFCLRLPLFEPLLAFVGFALLVAFFYGSIEVVTAYKQRARAHRLGGRYENQSVGAFE